MTRVQTVCVLSMFGLIAATGLAQDKQSPKQEGNAGAIKDTPVVITVTSVTLAEATGCWAKIYDGHNFRGRFLMLTGDQALPHLEFGIGFDWEGSIDSIEVGPKAKLVVYEDEYYREKKRELKPGEKVADLHRSVFSEGVESLQLICTQK